MEIEILANGLIARAQGKQRLIVAIAGPPGAGKSTLARNLKAALKDKSVASKIIPMDGFHLDNAILSEMGILERKGCPSSFDADGFVHLIKRLAKGEDNVAIPVFDRSRDIAISGAELITQEDKILIVEGNYLLLKDEPWSSLQTYWDETMFINPRIKELEKRLVARWVDHGFSGDAARNKAGSNDIPNAEYVLANSTIAEIVFG